MAEWTGILDPQRCASRGLTRSAPRRGTHGPFQSRRPTTTIPTVEHEPEGGFSPAERLPALYRAILDSVAELERRGERLGASQFRTEAIQAYSRSWDAAGRRRLESILRRAERALAVTPAFVVEPVADPANDVPQPAAESVTQRVPTTI